MRRERVYLKVIAALLAGAALGWVGGSMISGSAEPRNTGLPPVRPAGFQPASRETGGPEAALPDSLEGRIFAPTLEAILAERQPNRRREMLDDLIASFDGPTVRAFLETLPSLADWALERDVQNAAIARWAELDPRGAVEFAAGFIKDQRRGVLLIYPAISAWAEQDAAAAWAWARQPRSPRETRLYAMNGALGKIAERDPQAALAMIAELPAGENKAFFLHGIFGSLAQKDVAQAAEQALKVQPAGARQTALAQVAEAWARKDRAAAIRWFLQNDTGSESGQYGADNVMENILGQWVREEPEKAAAFASAQPPGGARRTLLDKLGSEWGQRDPAAAASWLQAQPKGVETTSAFESLIGAWAGRNPRDAGAFLLAQPGDRGRDDLFERFGSAWADSDPAAALAWARQQQAGAPELEHLVAGQAIGVMIYRDLASADRQLAELKTAKARSAAIEEVTNKFAQRSESERAVKWAMSLNPQHELGRALDWPVENWTRESPDAVGAWLNEQPASARKDKALNKFTETLMGRDAATAAAWAVTIGDETLRQKRVKEVIGTWGAKDGTAARAWLEQQRFAPAVQAELLKTLDRAARK